MILLITPIQAQTQDTSHESLQFDTDFTKSFENSFEYDKDLTIDNPSISSYVDGNITDTDAKDGYTYDYNEVVTGITDHYYNVSINFHGVELFVDKDTFGATDVYVNMWINGNYSRYPSEGNLQMYKGDLVADNITIFDHTLSDLSIYFEIVDDDGLTTQSLGNVDMYYAGENLLPAGNYYSNSSTSESTVYFGINWSEYNQQLTAGQLLDSYKPSLWVDDETDKTEMPDSVFGRIVDGNDNGIDSLAFQYIFYWNAEYTPELIFDFTSFKVHDNDFEVFYMYFDKNNMFQPYRIVYNDYFYTELSFPSENLVVFENNTVTNTFLFTTSISDELQYFFGANVNQTVDYRPLSDVLSWQSSTFVTEDTRTYSLLGKTTYKLTVETSFHSFDLGRGGHYYGFDYNVQDLSTDVIQSWYKIIDQTYEQGTSLWSALGIDVIKVAPFTLDIFQTFTAPYVISGYSKIVEDTAQLTKSKNMYLHSHQDVDIEVILNFPSTLNITYPKEISPDSSIDLYLQYIYSNKIEVTVNYDITSNINASYYLIKWVNDINTKGTFTFDLNTAELSAILSNLGLSKYSTSDISVIDSYLDLSELTISPKFVGKILDGNIKLNLWQLLTDVVGTSIPGSGILFKLLGLIIDDFSINANIVLESSILTNLNITTPGIDIIDNEIQFSEDSLIQKVTVNYQGSITAYDTIDIVMSDLNYQFNLRTDWSIDLGFTSPLNQILPPVSYQFASYPKLNNSVMTAPGTTFTIDIQKLLNNRSSDASLYSLSLNLSLLSLTTFAYLIRKKR